MPTEANRWLLLALTAALAASAAVWEVDPRWITENVDGLNTRDQGQLNQENLFGAQRIAIVAVPLSLLVLAIGLIIRRQSPSLPDERSWLGQPQARLDWLGLWVVWSLFGAIVGPEPLQAFAFSAATAAVLLGSRQLTRHSPALTAIAMVGAFVGFVGLSLAVKFMGLSDLSIRSGRLTLLSLEANQFGRMASLAALAGFYLALDTKITWLRALGGASAAVAVAGVAMTGSRTGFLATAAALGVLLLTKRSTTALFALGGTGVLAAIALAVSNVGRASLGALLRDGDSAQSLQSLTGRTNVWPVVIEQVGARPLAGHGFGTTTAILSPQSVKAGFTIEHTHNLWLHLLLTTGLVGLVLVVLALSNAVRHAGPTNRPWVFALLAYFLVAGISEAVLRNPDISLTALVFLVVLAESDPQTEALGSRGAEDAEPVLTEAS